MLSLLFLKTTTSTLTSLVSQVAALSDIVAWLLQAPATEPSLAPPPVRPAASSPVVPQWEPLDPRWEPNLSPPKPYSGEFDKCRGFLGQCHLLFLHQPSRFRPDGAKVALTISSLSDQALDRAMAVVGNNPQLFPPRLSSALPASTIPPSFVRAPLASPSRTPRTFTPAKTPPAVSSQQTTCSPGLWFSFVLFPVPEIILFSLFIIKRSRAIISPCVPLACLGLPTGPT